jgi:hypothetical protein
MKDLAAVVAIRRSAALACCGPPASAPAWLAGPSTEPEPEPAPAPAAAGEAVR